MLKNELKNIADSKALWSASENVETIQDMAHWRSVGRWNDDEWLNIGEKTYLKYLKLCSLASVDADSINSMLEWGPGGGANLYKFSESVSHLYGVDVSAASLRECAKQLDSIGASSFELFLIGKEPELSKTFLNEKIDFFLCVAVFQHFPSQDYGLRVLECAKDMVKEGGLALIQIRYPGKNKRTITKTENYFKNFVTFTSYEIGDFSKVCSDYGFKVLDVEVQEDVNYAFFYLQRNNN